MDYRSFGRTGVRVSPLCLGCMMFGLPADGRGNKPDDDEACRIIDHAIEQGLNFLDTANVYSHGGSETVVGKALKRNGHRDFIFLATKCHGNMHKMPADPTEAAPASAQYATQKLHATLNPNRWGNSRRQIIEQCEASLRRLQTDWIDLYQIHRPHPDCPIDETLRALDDLVRSGKVRYLGCSTFAAWQVVESLWASEVLKLNRFVCEQPPYNLMDRRIERELIPMAQTHGLALIPWSPLAGGLLTGKYTRHHLDVEGRWQGGKQGPAGRELTDAAFDIIETLTTMAQEKNCTPSQLALAWCMNQPGITSPIIGPRTFDQLTDNLGALDVTLTDDDRTKLDALAPPADFTIPDYTAAFGPHPHRW
jgi:aryl-alcohol dehydrogenase-like predicted oxidoreductase